MKTEKEQYYSNKILRILLENDIVTNAYIADKVGLVEKSVRSKLNILNEFLEQNNLGLIEKKQKVGIWLNASAEQKRKIQIFISQNESNLKAQDIQKRKNEMIRLIFMMKPNQPLTIANIADKMYISTPTALGVFKDVTLWFKENGIKIRTVRNKGICIEAAESVYRKVLKHYILQNCEGKNLQSDLEKYFPGLDVVRARELLLRTEEQWRLAFSDYSFREIWICLCIAIYRMTGRNPQSGLTEEEEKEIMNHNEYSFAQTLCEKLSYEFQMEVKHREVVALAEAILCANFVGGNISNDNNEMSVFDYDIQFRKFITEIIETMSVILDEDLTEDSILFTGLLSHIRPTIFRLRYGYRKSEAMLSYVKNEYKNVYRAAWSTCPLFEEYFEVQASEDELIYITLYVQVALERRKRPIHSVLVTQSGVGHSQLLSLKIKKEFPRIKEIEISRVQDFTELDCKQIDIIFSTETLPFEHQNIIQINPAMTDEAIVALKREVKRVVEHIAKNEEHLGVSCYTMLKPELLLCNVEIRTKDEIIRVLVDKLEESGYVSEGYYESVMEREKATTTAIGNGVAIPHGYSQFVNDSKVCVCTLKNPISWNGEMVDVIFLLAVKMKTAQQVKDIQQFYKYFIRLTDTDEKVDVLRSITSGGEMYKYLIG